jgi:hypothetical protein
MMKREYGKLLVALLGISLLFMPTPADALFWLTGNSEAGTIVTSGSILIPIPFINFTITESMETDIFGIAQLTISDYNDTDHYNTLQIRTGAKDPIHLPVPYGSLGLLYLMKPKGLSPMGVNQSDMYGYLSVGRNAVTSVIESSLHFSTSIEREKLIALATPLVPGFEAFEEMMGEGPFELECTLDGSLSGTATEENPTITGSFDYVLTLPDDIFTTALSPEIPVFDEFRGTLTLEVSFNWDHWNLFAPFVSVSLALNHTSQEEELPLEPITLDFLPRGTTILWLDRDE